jgi:small subunit ribosomal protein S17
VQDKTIVITQITRETHPLYGKKFTRAHKFTAHDEKNEAKMGDVVEITETRPISKQKRFILSNIIERSHEAMEVKKTALEEEMEAKLAEKAAKKAAEKAEMPVDETEGK